MIQNGQDTKTRSGGLSDLTDKELDEKRREHKNQAGLDGQIKPDLEELQREQRLEHRRSRYQGMSWLERTVRQAKELFTGGPEAQYKSMVRDAEKVYASIQQRNDGIESIVDEKSEQLGVLDDRLEDTKLYAETSLEQYERVTHRRERIEEELESLAQSSDYSPQLREKREQVRLVRKEQRSLYRETSQAMSALKRLHTHREQVEGQYEDLSGKLSHWREQEDALSIQLHEWRLHKDLRFPDHGKSVKELYESAGILAQKIGRFVEDELPGYEGEQVREDYKITFGSDERIPLLEKWSRTPSP